MDYRSKVISDQIESAICPPVKFPCLARGMHVWVFVATRTEYSFNR